MGSKGGSSIDTSGLEEATNRAIDLQAEMYDQTREDVAPWYDMGVGSVSRLSDLLGIGGGSMRTRDQIYNDMKSQYTQDVTTGQNGMYITPGGNLVTLEGAVNDYASTQAPNRNANIQLMNLKNSGGEAAQIDYLTEHHGYKPHSTTTQKIDYDALNKAVDDAYGSQEAPSDYGSLLERFDLAKFEEDPGYQFRKQESERALERALAAQGSTLGGGGVGTINPRVARALEEQSQGLASQEYQNAYNRYVQDNLNTYNMLMGTAGMGQGSTGILATGGQNYANNVGNLTTGLASAQLNAQMAEAAQPSMFETMMNTGAQVAGAYAGNPAAFSDKRLKENITPFGKENGHNVYKFNYKGDETQYIGVMAQEVLESDPSAVIEDNGFYKVHYDKIGVTMREA